VNFSTLQRVFSAKYHDTLHQSRMGRQGITALGGYGRDVQVIRQGWTWWTSIASNGQTAGLRACGRTAIHGDGGKRVACSCRCFSESLPPHRTGDDSAPSNIKSLYLFSAIHTELLRYENWLLMFQTAIVASDAVPCPFRFSPSHFSLGVASGGGWWVLMIEAPCSGGK
jgi:hypothetical protein